MEVRCRECNKLFRVSDDKITGIGIKFLCTRCGAYVKITREDFQQYTLSRGAATTPGLSDAASRPVAPNYEAQTSGFAGQAIADDTLEEKPPLFSEPEPFNSAVETPSEAPAELTPETPIPSLSKAEPPDETQPEQRPEPKAEPLFVPQHQAQPEIERETLSGPDRPTASLEPPSAPLEQPAKPQTEEPYPNEPSVSPIEEQPDREPAYRSRPAQTGKMFFVLIGAFILIGLAGYGIINYLQQPPQKAAEETAGELISSEGLQIVNPAGTVDSKDDLLVTGVIENTSDKERTEWYVVLEVYNAQGTVMSKSRLLNGNQIYSRRDYDILAGRGVHVQELKAKALHEKGIVIPPKGNVKFEIRFLKPPAGIASFIVQALPFNPVQLRKEIEEEMK